jgi:hypothetical protein
VQGIDVLDLDCKCSVCTGVTCDAIFGHLAPVPAPGIFYGIQSIYHTSIERSINAQASYPYLSYSILPTLARRHGRP